MKKGVNKSKVGNGSKTLCRLYSYEVPRNQFYVAGEFRSDNVLWQFYRSLNVFGLGTNVLNNVIFVAGIEGNLLCICFVLCTE